MGLRPFHRLASLLLLLLFCHGTEQSAGANDASEQLAAATKLESAYDMPVLDVSTPLATVPVVNPTGPTVTSPTTLPTTPASQMPPPTFTPPTLGTPVGPAVGGGSWCVASQSASPTALQVALDYACGQGGADCSAIQSGASCFNPDTVRDHASYAFNNYYQKNPVPTSCDFGGTAILTSTDPSSSTCQYPATSTGASVLNTTTPMSPITGPPAYENSPPGYENSPPLYGSMSPPDYGDNINAAAIPNSKKIALSLTCLLVATISLSMYK